MGARMVASILYKSEREVSAKLEQFGISVEDALRIVRAVVTAHNDAVKYDPKTAAGQFRYIYGTRAIRETFCALGWEIDRQDGIESVFDADNGVKVVYQSVDQACIDHKDPKSISDKGDASRKLVKRSTTGYLFPEMEAEEVELNLNSAKRINATTWYFCVSIKDDAVSAELSLPYSIEGNNFDSFIERIYIVTGGDWAGSGIIDLDDDAETQEFEPIITKK